MNNSSAFAMSCWMNRPAAVKNLNDQILAGRKKGYSDFSLTVNSSSTYSNICAPVAGVLDYYRDLGLKFTINNEDTQGYLNHTGFDFPLDAEKNINNFSLQYPCDKVWKFHTSEAVNALVNAYIMYIRQADIIESGVLQSLEWCLNEAMDNVLQHSQIETGYIMAQLHKSSQQFSVCIFDTGIGIFNSLKTSRYNPSSSLDAITLALQEKVTRDEHIGQGNGLWGLSQIVSEAKGSIMVSSAGAVYSKHAGVIRTIETGHFNLGKEHGTTLIDLQLCYSEKIDVAKALNGYKPIDLWLETFEAENGNVIIPVATQSKGTGTRKSAEQLRNLVTNIVLVDKKKVELDFSSVNLISSSFADELIGKLINEYGFVFFINNFKISHLSNYNISLLNRSVQQRMAQMYYDEKIEDAKDLP